ncbi:MAG: ATP-binding cassette domain-containing protein [Desulfobacterales bacterium]|nr:ATP-binding cassette domain-containing protein [Desulfobacterales bacterium]
MGYFTCENVTKLFGGLKALNNVSFEVEKGEIFALIGPNGAGKSTVLNCLNRFYNVDSGRFIFKDKDITHLAPHQIALNGIARTFQNIELFKKMTLIDNLLPARHIRRKSNIFSEMCFLPLAPEAGRSPAGKKRKRLSTFLICNDYRDQLVENLPYGIQKIIELGRALTMEPEIILLDEPTSGMNVEESQDLTFWITDIKRTVGHHPDCSRT